jgi:hypothetical protein
MYKNGEFHILPVLKMKENYYIFHNKSSLLFNEFTLSKKNFVPYDKQYSYKAIDECVLEETIVTEFEPYVCVFIIVDDSLKWTIKKNTLLTGNIFYERSMMDNDLIQFNFVTKKKVNKELIYNSLTRHKHHSSHNNIITSVELSVEPCEINEIIEVNEIKELTKSDYEEKYAPPIPDPLWDDFVLIDYDPVMY